ncbi:hypothetical protein KJ733_03990 [Patescibacteria group bacterium]|nr:hypothetical protein [Patescibacteria group bacterium]MBU1952045.1 hypothetical protein [Patescibacteria group bacterium]
MNFSEFQSAIHDKGYLILCLNDYKKDEEYYTFIGIQDKLGHGYHAECKSTEMDSVYEELISKI